jgi:glycine oxidase
MATFEVIIIGGGVIGGSIAYHLSKQGHKVLLLERDRIVSGASNAAAGMLGAQSEMHEGDALFELAVRSRSRFPKLAEELKELSGIDIGLVQKGMLKAAFTAEQAVEYQRNIAYQHSVGEQAAWLTASQAQRMEPALSEHICGAMYYPNEGQVIAPELSTAYIKAAAALGAEIREFTEVKSILIERGRVQGVTTNAEETIHCDHIVSAAGVWGNEMLEKIGLDLNIYPVKGECLSVVTPTPLIQATIHSQGCYLVPKRGGRIIVGATMIPHSYDRTVSMEGLFKLMGEARALIPSLPSLQWQSCWAGLRPQTPDGLPYIGESGHVKGLFIAMGHYRNGILLSPITGEIVTDLIEGTQSLVMNLSAFSPDRFSIHI